MRSLIRQAKQGFTVVTPDGWNDLGGSGHWGMDRWTSRESLPNFPNTDMAAGRFWNGKTASNPANKAQRRELHLSKNISSKSLKKLSMILQVENRMKN